MSANLVPIEELRIGDRLYESVYDRIGRLLVAGGTVVGETIQTRLAEEGVVRVLLEDRSARPTSDSIGGCSRCGLGLALKVPSAGSPALVTACSGCGAIYVAAFDGACPGLCCGPERVYCDRSRCAHLAPVFLHTLSPAELASVRALGTPGAVIPDILHSGEERRRSKRHRLHASVSVLPLDGSFRVLGPPLPATLRNLSFSGVCVAFGADRETGAAVVDFTPSGVPQLRLIVRVVWTAITEAERLMSGVICGRMHESAGDLRSLQDLLQRGQRTAATLAGATSSRG
ncbi:MAG: hypothetical protein KF688_10960 [Pirellulales bacterium]|nr:hypothetical protein [Pirellulales bacterium]